MQALASQEVVSRIQLSAQRTLIIMLFIVNILLNLSWVESPQNLLKYIIISVTDRFCALFEMVPIDTPQLLGRKAELILHFI